MYKFYCDLPSPGRYTYCVRYWNEERSQNREKMVRFEIAKLLVAFQYYVHLGFSFNKKRKVAFPSLFDKHKRNVFAEVCMSLRWVWEGVRKKAIGRISLSAGWQGNNAKNLIQIKLGIQLRIKLLFFFPNWKTKRAAVATIMLWIFSTGCCLSISSFSSFFFFGENHFVAMGKI